MSLNKSLSGSLNKKGIALFVPYNGKIADISESDTNKHFLNLTEALNENRTIMAVVLTTIRSSGTGDLYTYPNEGVTSEAFGAYQTRFGIVIIKKGSERLQYSLGVANDDYELYCFGYIVEA